VEREQLFAANKYPRKTDTADTRYLNLKRQQRGKPNRIKT